MTGGYNSATTCNSNYLGPSLAAACGASQFFVFMSILDTIVQRSDKISDRCQRIESVKTPDEFYDFVVIGGGAAGSAVAARLSEISEWKILLIEAGPDEPSGAGIPSFQYEFLETNIIWNYTTTNESHACLSTNGSCAWPAGKNLGGNTAHHSMIYLRGNPTDYNNWAAEGNEGWTWEEVEPFFKKGENNGEIHRVGRVHHGTGGPVSVERMPYLPTFAQSILDAAEEVGFGVSDDLNGDKRTGFSVVQTTSKDGVRQSSAAAFLRPIRNRKNLHISLNSHATRVIIKNKKAVGVEYHKDGQYKKVYVTKEVIVSGGALKSPQILLLSGIGPKEHLESFGIDVVLDSPGVGENLHDHPCSAIEFTSNDTDSYDNDYAVAAEYLAHQTGPMSSNGLTQVTGILSSDTTTLDFPDTQLLIQGYLANCAPGEIGALQSDGRRTILIGPAYLHPKSRGRVTLASNDPFENPVLWSNYYGDPRDIQGMVNGVKMAMRLVDTEALRVHNLTISPTPVEGCLDYEFQSDEYWACAVQQTSFPIYHQAGTCKMGNSSDPMAVVDSHLRVHGIEGLRVADASIMPQVTSGNIVAPTMMIGERAANFIKKDWGQFLETLQVHQFPVHQKGWNLKNVQSQLLTFAS